MSKVEWESDYCTKISEHFSVLPDITDIMIEDAGNVLDEMMSKLMETSQFIDDLEDMIKWSIWFKETYKSDGFSKEDKVKVSTDIMLFFNKEGNIKLKVSYKETEEFICWIMLDGNRYGMEDKISKFRQIMKMLQRCESLELLHRILYLGVYNDEFEIIICTFKQQILQTIKVQNVETKRQILLPIIKESEMQRNKLMYNVDSSVSSIKSRIRYVISNAKSEYQNKRNEYLEKKIEDDIDYIRKTLCWINKFSFWEMLAYYCLGEIDASGESFKYYVEYLNKVLYDTFYKKEQENLLRDRMKDIYDIADNIDGIGHVYHINQRSTL